MVAAAATEPLFPMLMKPLLDGGFAAGQQPLLPPHIFAAALVVIFILRGALTFTGPLLHRLGGQPRGARPARGDVRTAGALSDALLRRPELGGAALQGRLRRGQRQRGGDHRAHGAGARLDRHRGPVRVAAVPELEADPDRARHRAAGGLLRATAVAAPAQDGARLAARHGRPGARAGGDHRVPPRGEDLRRPGVRGEALRARQPHPARLQHAPEGARGAHHAGDALSRRLRAVGDRLHRAAGIARRAHHGGRVRLLHHRHADAVRADQAPHRSERRAAKGPGGRRERVRHDRRADRGGPRHGGARRARAARSPTRAWASPIPRAPSPRCATWS